MIDRSGIFTASAESEAFGKFKLPNQKLWPKLRLMPKLRYFSEASVFLQKLYQKKLKNCKNSTAEVSKMVKRYASASVTSPPKLLLPKLLPNSSAEALAGARFGRSLQIFVVLSPTCLALVYIQVACSNFLNTLFDLLFPLGGFSMSFF